MMNFLGARIELLCIVTLQTNTLNRQNTIDLFMVLTTIKCQESFYTQSTIDLFWL